MIPSKRRLPVASLLSILLLSIAILLIGCRSNERDPASPSIRLINAVPGSQALRIVVNGKGAVRGPGFSDGLRSFNTSPGQYKIDLSVQLAGGKMVSLPDVHLTATKWRRYTYIVFEAPDGGVRVKSVSDKVDQTKPTGHAIVRAINAVVGMNRVDVSLNSIVTFSSLKFASESDLVSLAPGQYQITALDASVAYSPLADAIGSRLDDGSEYTIVLTGGKNDGGVKVDVIKE